MGCDLLSISIFDLLIYTVGYVPLFALLVVICFQFLSLTYWYTLYPPFGVLSVSCDLLSISIFDLLIYTPGQQVQVFVSVVICFQFLSLTYWYTLGVEVLLT